MTLFCTHTKTTDTMEWYIPDVDFSKIIICVRPYPSKFLANDDTLRQKGEKSDI